MLWKQAQGEHFPLRLLRITASGGRRPFPDDILDADGFWNQAEPREAVATACRLLITSSSTGTTRKFERSTKRLTTSISTAVASACAFATSSRWLSAQRPSEANRTILSLQLR
jgi:hypothetical protein